MNAEKITIHDVAKKAGVSQPTVSKVLNKYPNVKPSTRQKVLDAIAELGFIPDEIARSMVTNKTNTIGLIVQDIANPFYAETAQLVIRHANMAGYEIVVLDAGHRDRNMEHALKTLVSKRVDGIIAASVTRDEPSVKRLAQTGFPIVLYNRKMDDAMTSYIEVDNELGVRMAMSHLMENGHRRIGYVSGPLKYSTFHERYRGYISSLRDSEFVYTSDWIYDGVFEYDAIYSYVQRVLGERDGPTSFVAASDQMAMAVMDAVVSMGLSVPRDISIIGFDNIGIAANPLINLTTVSQQKKKMAQLALEILLKQLGSDHRDKQPVQVTLEPELIIRGTTGPCLKANV
ncbi:LacI family DNA-binding transcriptional regulator [Paenibacillus hamazuiensis]|uniref:LacI family DNA-binding transcriptional regulator n=1 Tax=Paenibacillus hamazuiensis TaxID=2936508 RepID=UPI00200E67C7|nr:LacI family DNA-binding transcriptional regulator [Paenibacillus hamazuiensis]